MLLIIDIYESLKFDLFPLLLGTKSVSKRALGSKLWVDGHNRELQNLKSQQVKIPKNFGISKQIKSD